MGGNLSHGPKIGFRDLWAIEPIWSSFVTAPAPGTPRIGYAKGYMAEIIAARKMPGHVMTKQDPRWPEEKSCAVQMPDGSWGYWTRHGVFGHGDVLGGWVILAGGRVINGRSWWTWDQGRVLDGTFPTIWMSQNMRRRWTWQVNQQGQLTQSGF
jgi:hypothetical protein